MAKRFYILHQVSERPIQDHHERAQAFVQWDTKHPL